MEAALAIAGLVTVMVLVLAGLGALSAQLRCVDAAREAARLAARGDGNAIEVARRIAPAGASIRITDAGTGFVRAEVQSGAPLLPGLTIAADAVAAREPGE